MTRFGWNGKIERERENDERREEEEVRKCMCMLVVGVLDVLFFVFAENERKKQIKDSNRDTCSFLLDSSLKSSKNFDVCYYLRFIYLFVLAIPYPILFL